MLSSGTNAPIEIVPRVVANTLVVMGILYFSTMLGLVVEAVQACLLYTSPSPRD